MLEGGLRAAVPQSAAACACVAAAWLPVTCRARARSTLSLVTAAFHVLPVRGYHWQAVTPVDFQLPQRLAKGLRGEQGLRRAGRGGEHRADRDHRVQHGLARGGAEQVIDDVAVGVAGGHADE